jgi:hypothetical protein
MAYRTEEWGYMDTSANTCRPASGQWPIDMCFSPDHDANKLEAEKERTEAKKDRMGS